MDNMFRPIRRRGLVGEGDPLSHARPRGPAPGTGDGITAVDVADCPRYWYDGQWHPYARGDTITVVPQQPGMRIGWLVPWVVLGLLMWAALIGVGAWLK